jgi:recombination protein RecT
MVKKTCVKQAYKYWPKTDRLEKAIHFLNTEGGEGLEQSPTVPEAAQPPAELLEQARDAAMQGVAAYEAFWANAGKANRKLLAEHHEGLKAAARRADNPPQDVTDVQPKDVAEVQP